MMQAVQLVTVPARQFTYFYSMKSVQVIAALLFLLQQFSVAQSRREDIYTDFVLYQKRELLKKDLQGSIVRTFSLPIDSNTEYKFESSCRSVSQFMIVNEEVEQGFVKMFQHYDLLDINTKRAFLEAVYGLYPDRFAGDMQKILDAETDPGLFAVAAVYLHRQDHSELAVNDLKIKMVESFPGYYTLAVLSELSKYLDGYAQRKNMSSADIAVLFRHQALLQKKIIYSFQRHNRDYPGLAIVQNADGRFMRHPDGRLMIFQQLARSASNLPYFIKNGNTPQGVYSVLGTAVANNRLIGPTPNLQLIMPFENKWEKYFQLPAGAVWDSSIDSLQSYLELVPPPWRRSSFATESFYAGKIGRNAIIAHGTTIDPEYFADKPFYPLTPTLGCLCAKELWNISNGRLLVSEQFNLVSAFNATPGNKGYLYVINVDDQQKAISRQEVESWVNAFEKKPAIAKAPAGKSAKASAKAGK